MNQRITKYTGNNFLAASIKQSGRNFYIGKPRKTYNVDKDLAKDYGEYFEYLKNAALGEIPVYKKI